MPPLPRADRWPDNVPRHELEELLAALEIMQLTDALDDPRLAAAIRRMGLDVVRGAIDRLESRTRTGELASQALHPSPGAGGPEGTRGDAEE